MKKLLLLIVLPFFLSCDSENANDCFQTAGTIIQEEITVAPFTEILINPHVRLVLKEGTTQKVIIESGENLLSDIEVNVVGNTLEVSNNNNCNFVRDYGLTTVYVMAPNITKIRNSSELEVKSDGILNYPTLTLLSEDYQNDFDNSGDFILSLNTTTSLKITANGNNVYYLTGTAEQLNVNFAGGNCRLEASQLITNKISVFARSTNDMLLHPINEITGEMRSTGNLILYNHPPIVDVIEHYTGSVLYN